MSGATTDATFRCGLDHPSPATFLGRGTQDSSPGMPGPAQIPLLPAGGGLGLPSGLLPLLQEDFLILSGSLAAGEVGEVKVQSSSGSRAKFQSSGPQVYGEQSRRRVASEEGSGSSRVSLPLPRPTEGHALSHLCLLPFPRHTRRYLHTPGPTLQSVSPILNAPPSVSPGLLHPRTPPLISLQGPLGQYVHQGASKAQGQPQSSPTRKLKDCPVPTPLQGPQKG